MVTGISHRIGVVSDTHGLLRPAVAEALQGCEWIVGLGLLPMDVEKACYHLLPFRRSPHCRSGGG